MVMKWCGKDKSIECIDGKEFIATVRQWSGTHEWTDSQSTDHCIHFLVYTTTRFVSTIVYSQRTSHVSCIYKLILILKYNN